MNDLLTIVWIPRTSKECKSTNSSSCTWQQNQVVCSAAFGAVLQKVVYLPTGGISAAESAVPKTGPTAFFDARLLFLSVVPQASAYVAHLPCEVD